MRYAVINICLLDRAVHLIRTQEERGEGEQYVEYKAGIFLYFLLFKLTTQGTTGHVLKRCLVFLIHASYFL